MITFATVQGDDYAIGYLLYYNYFNITTIKW